MKNVVGFDDLFWSTVTSNSLTLYVMSANNARPDEKWLAPFLLSMVAAAAYYTVKGVWSTRDEAMEDSVYPSVGETRPVASVRRGVEGEPSFVFTKDASEVMLLQDLTASLVPLAADLPLIATPFKAVTVAAFVNAGAVCGFTLENLSGRVLGDGLATPVGRTNWTQITDALADARLMVKARRQKTRLVLSPKLTLRHVIPEPMPSNWRGWDIALPH